MKKNLMVFFLCAVFFIINISVIRELGKIILRLAKKSSRLELYYNLFHNWMLIKEEGKNLEKYFMENDIKNIGVYGMGMTGVHFLKDLQSSSYINILYGIDRSVEKVDADIKIYKPNDKLPVVDMIVVTAAFAFDEIVDELRETVDCPIVSIEEVVREAY